MTQRQHYISKILTKPWELSNSGRHVWYFDWEKDQILESSSKSLFAKNDLWPKDYEKIFDQKVEARLVADIKTIIFGSPQLEIERSSNAIRSILTLHHFNAMRSMRAHWNRNDIDRFIKLSSTERIEEIELFARDYVFVALPLSHGYEYFFAESAFFRIPLVNNTTAEIDFGFAIPLHPRFAFGMFPKNYNRVEQVSDSNLVTLSIGSNFDRRIILPPSYAHNRGNIKLIETMKRARMDNIYDFNFIMNNSEDLKRRSEITNKYYAQ